MFAVAPLGIVPRLQITLLPFAEQVPWLIVAKTNVNPLGRLSVYVTFVAVAVPLLVTVLAKVKLLPTLAWGNPVVEVRVVLMSAFAKSPVGLIIALQSAPVVTVVEKI